MKIENKTTKKNNKANKQMNNCPQRTTEKT